MSIRSVWSQGRQTVANTFVAAGVNSRALLTTLSLLLILTQGAAILYFAVQAADSRPVISGIDNDGANAMDVTERSRWYSDNGFASYGPVYFRVSNTLSWTLTGLTEPGSLEPADGRSRAIHYALTLTSILSLFGLALLISASLLTELWQILLIATLLVRALLITEPWREFLLRPHPDHFLALIVGIATYFSLRFWRKPEDDSARRLSAWSWGVALATKMSVLFHLPFAVLPVLLLSKRRVHSTVNYLLHMAAAYFAIGFPQNFNVPRLFRFLKSQSGVNAGATADSVREWFQFWSEQAAAPLFLIAILLITGWIQRTSRERAALKVYAFACALAFGPLLLLLGQNPLVPHSHYPMPIVATQLVLLAGLGAMKLRSLSRLPGWITLACMVILLSVYGSIPGTFNQTLNSRLICRPEARALYGRIQKLSAEGKKIYTDPYGPARDKMPGVFSSWRTTKSYIVEGKFDVLILKPHYFNRYLSEDGQRYAGTYNSDPQSSGAFYQIFAGKESVTDPEIGNWKQILSDACTWQVWEKAP